VKNSKDLWASWMVFSSRLPRVALLTKDFTTPVNGFPIHPAPSMMITPASSGADSESETESTSSASAGLASDSAATSESGDDQGGMGAVATAVAQLTMGIQTAMPNVREKIVSISARNHEPESFTHSWTTANEGP
jgi:hypothetical protein